MAAKFTNGVARPFLNTVDAGNVLQSCYGTHATDIKLMSSYGDQNIYVEIDAGIQCTGDKFVLKIFDSNESSKEGWVESRVDVMLFLANQGIPCSVPVRNNKGHYTMLKKYHLEEENDGCEDNNKDSNCRRQYAAFKILLMTYIPGTRLIDITKPVSPVFLYNLGQFTANMNQSLLEFDNISATFKQQSSEYRYSLDNLLEGKQFLDDLPISRYSKVKHIFEEFERCVVSNKTIMRKSVIHGDLTPSNIIVKQSTSEGLPELQGVIDFGDAVYSHFIYEIAIALAGIMEVKSYLEPIEIAGHFLAGYQFVLPLEDVEKEVIYTCVLSRLAQIQLLCTHDIKTRPKNAHIEEGLDERWALLDKVFSADEITVKQEWEKIALSYANKCDQGSLKV